MREINGNEKVGKEDNVEKKLNRKKKTIAPPPSYEEDWLAAGLTKEENIHGIVYKRTVDYDNSYKHGDIVLSKLEIND